MVKKRKTEMEASEDSSFFQSFVGAANAVSHMYTQALKEQRGAGQAATRSTLERIAQWTDVQGGSEMISKCALRELLNEEHMKAGGEGLYTRSQIMPQNMEEAESPAASLHGPCGPWTPPTQPNTSSSFHMGGDLGQFQSQLQGSHGLENVPHEQPGNFSFPQFGMPGLYNQHSLIGRAQGPSNGG